MSNLPQEIIDRFIDEFFNSIENLKNLSLVNSSWVHRARYHLFRFITLGPQDLKEIRHYYAELKATDTELGWHVYYQLSNSEQKLLRSPLAQNPQPYESFLSSIADTLPDVRGLRLESLLRLGGVRRISPEHHFRKWLELGRDKNVEDLLVDKDFSAKQKDRWEAVDLPWGHHAGIHALPFRNLRYIHIQWSVFSWTPPTLSSGGDDFLVCTNPNQWPGYQLAMLLKSNADTLDHVSIDEYPGFRVQQYNSTFHVDALLGILTQNVPNLQSLSLGGLRRVFHPHLHVTQPLGSSSFLESKPAIYPSGEEVPHAFPAEGCSGDVHRSVNSRQLSLKRFFLRGFDSEATSLIEDVFLNGGVSPIKSIQYLALSAMPEDYNYMFLFSRVFQSLTHLTLDLDQSTLHLELKLYFFPRLECVQLMIPSTYRTIPNLYNMVGSLSDNVFHLDGSMPSVHTVRRLHIALAPGVHSGIAEDYMTDSSIDEFLLNLVQHRPSGLSKSVGWTRVEMVTVDLPNTTLEKAFPMTFETGSLTFGETDEWWRQSTYLRRV
ncbi:hypothetical protein F5050DRAFT_1770450 [Lentinula boryana]|uniref:F-box domain-containing protein n=1 Tax=Lentinula boryana TaxID=40481 RepID=A0ABQ8Q933_9AGAR|nr:hypothetical protein F5050DRAFT_1770450 [Lentinula boryana]